MATRRPRPRAAGRTTPGWFGIARSGGLGSGQAPDVVLAGAPLELAGSAGAGAAVLPTALRAASVAFGTYSEALGIDLRGALSLVDGGDLELTGVPLADALEAVSAHVEGLARQGVVSGLVGGEEAITLGALRGLRRAKLKPVGLVHIDASPDTGPTRGAAGPQGVVAVALAERLVRPDLLVHVGLRGPLRDAEELAPTVSRGAEVIKADDVKWDLHGAVSQLRRVAARGELYVSVDLSALDPAFAPGVLLPRAGGLSTWELQQLLRVLVGAPLVGFDVVGASPARDPSGLTALAGATVLHELLAVLADTRRSSGPAPSSRGRRRGRVSA